MSWSRRWGCCSRYWGVAFCRSRPPKMAAAALRPCRGYKRLGSASAATVIRNQGSGHKNTSHWACFEELLHATMWPHCKVHQGCIHLEVKHSPGSQAFTWKSRCTSVVRRTSTSPSVQAASATRTADPSAEPSLLRVALRASRLRGSSSKVCTKV
jgi:hypothetical protein